MGEVNWLDWLCGFLGGGCYILLLTLLVMRYDIKQAEKWK